MSHKHMGGQAHAAYQGVQGCYSIDLSIHIAFHIVLECSGLLRSMLEASYYRWSSTEHASSNVGAPALLLVALGLQCC